MKDSGRCFVFIKTTQGQTGRDWAAAASYEGARAAGLLVGSYHFFNPNRPDAKLQAAAYARRLAELGAWDLPPALDLEDNPKQPTTATSAEIVARAAECLEELRKLTGWRPLIYAGTPYLEQHGLTALASRYDLWLAQYRAEAKIDLPKGWERGYRFWQFAGDAHGRCPGVVGPVDENLFAGRLEDLENWARDQRRG